jgi:hypothetical protein
MLVAALVATTLTASPLTASSLVAPALSLVLVQWLWQPRGPMVPCRSRAHFSVEACSPALCNPSVK